MPRYILVFALCSAIGMTGCGACRTSNFVAERPHSCNRCLDSVQPPPRYTPPLTYTPPPGRSFAVVPPAPPPGKTLPPGPAVEGGSATFVPPSGDTPPPPSPDSPQPGSISRSIEPPASAEERADVRLGPPGPIRRDYTTAPPDATKEPPVANVPSDERKPKSVDPDGKDMPQAIDLPGFAIAAPGVATGIKPFPDGISWLAEKGYKTVLHLRAPGDDNAATRRMFENKGIRYVSLEASSSRFTKEVYDSFVKLVKEAGNHPLFVYDKDGSVTGGLWFVYNRMEKGEPADKAKAEAQRLGLRFDDDPEHQAMVLAAQKLLSELRP